MAKHLIREVKTTPPLPAELIVLRREDLYRFVTAARRAVADLQAELNAERARNADVDAADAPWVPDVKPDLFSLPPWTERPVEADDAAFFNALRDPDPAPHITPKHPSAWAPVDIERLA